MQCKLGEHYVQRKGDSIVSQGYLSHDLHGRRSAETLHVRGEFVPLYFSARPGPDVRPTCRLYVAHREKSGMASIVGWWGIRIDAARTGLEYTYRRRRKQGSIAEEPRIEFEDNTRTHHADLSLIIDRPRHRRRRTSAVDRGSIVDSRGKWGRLDGGRSTSYGTATDAQRR